MKNYSNYHGVNFNDKLINNGNLILEKTLTHDVTIQGVPEKVLIYDKYRNDDGTVKNIVAKIGKLKRGYVVQFNNHDWIVVSLPENNVVYEKAIIKLCNNILTLKGTTTKTQVGTDHFGRPQYQETISQDILLPCIVEKTIYTNNEDKPINLPDNQIRVTIPYTVHDDITEGKYFTMYEENYKIGGIDKTLSINGVGLMIIYGERSG
jgi:hypothetical protein